MATTTLVVLEGDETGQELLAQALRVLDPAVSGLDLEFERYDLSLARRRESANGVVHDAARALRRAGFGLKAATVTPTRPGDVGSPNAILRREIGATVILRVGRPLPGVAAHAGVRGPIAIVRMAVGDAYDAEERRESVPLPDGGEDEVAVRTERISRRVCRAVAETAFRQADRLGATVFGGPKFTVSPVYEGMLKEELDRAARRHPHVPYDPQLLDTTYALLERRGSDAIVVPALNRDGDCLSDLVLPWFGTIAAAESTVLATDADGHASVVMAEAPHGTAPTLFGQNRANPMAMILAAAAVLEAMPAPAPEAAAAIRAAVREALADGVRTEDLGGTASTTAFTDAVVARVADRRASARA
jgi:isocitrate dehydrogenase (NAD+)